MVLINPLQWPLEGVGPEDLDFFGSQNGNEQSDCHLGPKNWDFEEQGTENII